MNIDCDQYFLLLRIGNRLAIAVGIFTKGVVSPEKLWGKTDAVMTAAATKNLIIEKSLGTDHIPYHLLCKSHTVEALDRSNLEVLKQIENSVA